MHCIIIEDQPPAQRLLKKYIDDVESLELKATFTDTIKAMEFLKSEQVDLIFLDIHLPKISGIDFLKILPNPPQIILTTAFPDYALESYEFDVVDYLLKPFTFQRFLKAVSKLPTGKSVASEPGKAAATQHTGKELFVKSGYEHIRISTSEIIFIRSDADYSEIFVPDKKHLTSEPLRYWEEILDKNQFIRVHKSYIVNTSKIVKVMRNQVHMINKTVVPIGRAYRDNLVRKFL